MARLIATRNAKDQKKGKTDRISNCKGSRDGPWGVSVISCDKTFIVTNFLNEFLAVTCMYIRRVHFNIKKSTKRP